MYSENSLLLEGDQTEIQRFVEQAEYPSENDKMGTAFSFQKFIPIPKGVSNDWDWCEDNWGIDFDIEAYFDKQKQIYYFNYIEACDSAIKGFLVVSKQFPQIKFTFEYYNHDFEDRSLATYGELEFRNGIIELEEKDIVRVLKCPNCDYISGHAKFK